jgi:hypothetical protein
MKLSVAGRSTGMVCALISAWAYSGECRAQIRPVALEESATITAPDPSWNYFGRFVVVDGDWALIQRNFSPDRSAWVVNVFR